METNTKKTESAGGTQRPGHAAADELDLPLGQLDQWLDAPMWLASLLFLILFTGTLLEIRTGIVWPFDFSVCAMGIFVLWPLFALEWILHIIAGSQNRWRHVAYCLMPPLRMGGRDHATWQHIWFPFSGWKRVDRSLVRRIEKAFSRPMVFIALMVLPLLAIDWYWKPLVAEFPWMSSPWLRFALETAMSVIWFAFAFELIIMTGIVRNKLAYCVEHWIDVVIVLLPVVAFLRILQLLRLGRAAQVARLLRLYRVRGMMMRAYRAFLLLDVVRRFVQVNPERRLDTLRERLEEQTFAIDEIRREILELEARLEARRAEEELDDTRETTGG